MLSYKWDLLLRDYLEAKECIEDLKGCDDFEELCQRNLAANTGILHAIGGLLLFYKLIYFLHKLHAVSTL